MTTQDKSVLPGAEAGQPLYAQLADRLRDDILAGRHAAGQRLPGEFELAHQFGASRPTVRAALALLQREGLVVKRHGLGSFVRLPRVRQTLARLETLDETIAEQGLTASTRVLAYRFEAPSGAVRAALATEADVLAVRRLHSTDDEPIALVDLFLPGHVGAHFSRRDVDVHAFYALLPARLGIVIGPATQTVRAEAASEDVARLLRIARGEPVLACERVTYAANGEPVIYALFRYRADRFEVRVSLSAHDWKVPWVAAGLAPLGRVAAETAA